MSRKKLDLRTAQAWMEGWAETYPEMAQEVNDYELKTAKTVATELGIASPTHPLPKVQAVLQARFPLGYLTEQSRAVYLVSRLLYGIKKSNQAWVRKIEGTTLISGDIFADVIGAELIAIVHRTNLEKSDTFSKLYRELLPYLDARFNNQDADSAAIKAELDGTYELPKLPEKKQPEITQTQTPTAVAVPASFPDVAKTFRELTASLDRTAVDFLLRGK